MMKFCLLWLFGYFFVILRKIFNDMKNRLILMLTLVFALPMALCAQTLSLDSCRSMALRNNKQLKVADAKIDAAQFTKKQAFAAYLPGIDFQGMYLWNQKELSLLSEDQMLPTKSFNLATGTYDYNLVINPATGKPLVVNGQPVPSTVAMIPKSAMTFDIHNVFAGAVTLTQPIFMGGKIRALNNVAQAATNLAKSQRNSVENELIYNVDAAYWMVVSLRAKESLAQSYVSLLDSLCANVDALKREGLATQSDMLTVEVKRNEANVDMVKVRNGVSLARMALAQLCGLPVNSQFTLADEGTNEVGQVLAPVVNFNMEDVYSRRPEIQSLQSAVTVYEEKARAARADMMPTLAAMAAYSFSNPNMFNGFEQKFSGMFSVGSVLKIPVWHWGGNYYKYRAAKAEALVQKYNLEEAREKIELQVNQAAFKMQEAYKVQEATKANLAKADDNLRSATIGYREGVLTTNDVLAAQTAWLKANSENIDAEIDIRLCSVYLSKVLGTLK